MNDTIVALATAMGISAINIIKLSGKDAIKIVNKIYKGKDLSKVETHTINFGHIVDKDEYVDEVLVSVFKSPKSYTSEDVVEINCHGGIAATNKIMELVLQNGARLAEPGEFLKRAFLNGKVDLIKAESVQDLIFAKTESARKMSIKGIDGTLSKLIKNLRKDIMEIIANIEVNIDYPEYDDALIITNKILKEKLNQIKIKLSKIYEQSKNGKMIKEGINIGIVGKPNVGKSSLLNYLIQENKAIVTNIEGTTRDIVEGSIILNGIQVNFLDTAGIRNTKNYIEKIGVEKSLNVFNEADLLLVILDNSKEFSEDDKKIIKKTKTKKVIYVVNKTDLKTKLEKDFLPKEKTLEISIKTDTGINKLKEKIIEELGLNNIEQDFTYLSNSRQIALIKKCLEIIKEIEKSNSENIPVDFIEIDLRNLWNTLGEIIGETYKEELLNEIFSKFCLGK